MFSSIAHKIVPRHRFVHVLDCDRILVIRALNCARLCVVRALNCAQILVVRALDCAQFLLQPALLPTQLKHCNRRCELTDCASELSTGRRHVRLCSAHGHEHGECRKKYPHASWLSASWLWDPGTFPALATRLMFKVQNVSLQHHDMLLQDSDSGLHSAVHSWLATPIDSLNSGHFASVVHKQYSRIHKFWLPLLLPLVSN